MSSSPPSSLARIVVRQWQHGYSICSAAPSNQAPTPHCGAPKARSLTAKARTERSLNLLQCASSSDTVREIEYQILQINQSYVCRVLRLTLLAPTLVEAILDRRHPSTLQLRT